MTKFVLVGTQRSGTTLLRSSLNSHPDIRCLGEVFYVNKALDNPEYKHDGPVMGKHLSPEFSSWREYSYQKYIRNSLLRKSGHWLLRGKVTRSYLDMLYSLEGHEAVGFKVMIGQLRRFPAVLPYINSKGVSVIHMLRENPFDILLSRLSMVARGYAHSGSGPGEDLRVLIPTRNLLKQLRDIRNEGLEWRDRLGKNVPYMRVTYEQFVNDRAEVTRDLLRFLGVDESIELKSELVKLNAAPVSDMVENMGEVTECLRGTEFEWCVF